MAASTGIDGRKRKMQRGGEEKSRSSPVIIPAACGRRQNRVAAHRAGALLAYSRGGRTDDTGLHGTCCCRKDRVPSSVFCGSTDEHGWGKISPAATVDETVGWLVPRKDLVGTLQVLLRTRRLQMSRALPAGSGSR